MISDLIGKTENVLMINTLFFGQTKGLVSKETVVSAGIK